MAQADLAELGTIVSVWAHPDDEAYLCGGLMATAADAGLRVVCVTATRGELGVTDPVRWPPERMAEIREAELAACLEILGVKEHRWLGFRDGGCAAIPLDEGAEAVAAVLREVRPDTVVTFAADGQTGHPDHIAVHHWCVAAVRETGIGTLHVVANTAEWLAEFQTPLNQLGALVGDPPTAWSGPLSVELRLGDDMLSRKLAALAAQTSQTEAFRAAVGEDFYRLAFGTERFGILAV
ncbi:MAG TPA: PIG-L family deacetylase [Propionibacteriaceae bacterium]|nr:PIG-L family deacetylase [Propionibacteriaceae bacterium]